MNNHIETSEEEVKVKIGKQVVAKFEATYSGDLIEGNIDEAYDLRMTSYDLIEIATWLLEKAKDRAREEAI